MSILRKLKEQSIEKFKGGAADLQDLSGPNKVVGTASREQHHGLTEDEIEEARSTTTALGGTHNPRKNSAASDLAGGGGRTRALRQGSGNQRRTVATYTEEATRIVKKKISEKKGEQPLGRTLTNQPGDSIDTSPEKPELR